jgi:hypothetical protein
LSSVKFWQKIKSLLPSFTLSENEAQALSKLNPSKIYVENVRSILGVSHESAKRICETAVRQGVFERRVEVMCPDGVVAASADSEANLPATVQCWHEEQGHLEAEELPTKDLEKTIFYRLIDDTDSIPYGQTA